ncbi:MAG: SH3 domain-containing protein [Clostridia bacterium]|nr:SH3 domain-containing protein [Clostridia bacterium]
MMNRMQICLFLLIALMTGLFMSAAGGETLVESTGTVTADNAAIRSEPTKAVPKLASLKSGDTVTVTDVISNTEGDWLYVIYSSGKNTYEGYILMDYVSVELKDENGNIIALPAAMRASAKAEIFGGYNHVGYNWTHEFYINGQRITGGMPLTLRAGDTIELSAFITENDSYSDTGSKTVTKTITQAELDRGFNVSFSVRVSENRGRYSGSSCEWRVTFYFTRV